MHLFCIETSYANDLREKLKIHHFPALLDTKYYR